MAIVFIQSAKGRNANTGASAVSATINTTTGHALILGISWYDNSGGTSLTSVTDNDGGSAPNLDLATSHGTAHSGVYSKFNITGKVGYAATITLSATGYSAISVTEVAGVETLSARDRTASGTGTVSATATTAALRASNEFAFALGADVESVDSLSLSAGWTVDQNTENANTTAANLIAGHKIVSSNAALSLTVTGQNNVQAIIATYLPAFVSIKGLSNNHASIGANLVQRERNQTFSARISFKFDGILSGNPSVLFSNVKHDGVYAGYELYVEEAGGSHLRVRLIHDINNNYLGREGTTNVADSTWRVAFITYDGSSTAAGVKIYLDGVLETMTTENDTLSLSMVDTGQQLYIASQFGRDLDFYLNGACRGLMIWSDLKDATFVANNSALDVLPAADGNTLLRLAFSEGTGLTSADTGGAGDTATLTSAAMWDGSTGINLRLGAKFSMNEELPSWLASASFFGALLKSRRLSRRNFLKSLPVWWKP